MADGTREIVIGCGPYDRIAAIADGRVTIPGYRMDVRVMPVTTIPPAAFARRELGLAEVAVTQLLPRIEAGDTSYVGLPVYPSLAFRHDSIFVRKGGPVRSVRDLAEARIGTTQYFGATTTWVRGMLNDQFGVDLSNASWIMGPIGKPAGEIKPHHKAGVACTYVAPGTSLDDAVDRREVDALICYQIPACVRDGRFVRLIDDSEAEETDYFRRFAVPILHLFAIRDDLRVADPRLPAKLEAVLTEAKDLALERLNDTACFNVSLPALPTALERAKRTMGEDIWPYGMDKTGGSIDTFLRYAFEQGLTARLVTRAEMFPDFA